MGYLVAASDLDEFGGLLLAAPLEKGRGDAVSGAL